MRDLDWGNLSQKEILFFQNESITSYNRIFDVEENDVVVDIGAFVGSFTHNIIDKNPEHVWVMEPVEEHFRTLYKNLKHYQVSFTRAAITDKNEIDVEWAGIKGKAKGIKFKDFIENNCIDKIDFFKCDCEGGEYEIFTIENLNFLKNIPKIVCEFHLINEQKEQFRYFRDNILSNFNKYHVYSVDGVDIKWDIFNEHFIEYYFNVLFHFDNR